jgi:hypothetical protein
MKNVRAAIHNSLFIKIKKPLDINFFNDLNHFKVKHDFIELINSSLHINICIHLRE